jgi:hypothetical protein
VNGRGASAGGWAHSARSLPGGAAAGGGRRVAEPWPVGPACHKEGGAVAVGRGRRLLVLGP